MGAASKLSPHRAGTVRRVVHRGNVHICGLCRSQYADLEAAEACVGDCWRTLLALDPVIPRSHVEGSVLRCRFCARDFKTRGSAMQCAADCRARRIELEKRQHEVEADDDLAQPVRPRFLKVKTVARLERPSRASRAASMELSAKTKSPQTSPPTVADTVPVEKVTEEAASLSAPLEAPVSPVASAAPAVEEPSGEEAAAARMRRKQIREMFRRDGARYVCNECNGKYFTKDEVVKCFESH